MVVKLRSAYIPHTRIRKENVGPSMTQQSFREESEINNILARYTKTGVLEHVNKYGAGAYNDMPASTEFVDAMNMVTEANSMFADLPADVRNRFKNDPVEFLEFVNDPDNTDEMVKMGLLEEIIPDGVETGPPNQTPLVTEPVLPETPQPPAEGE